MADFQFRPMRTSDHRAVAALWRESAALMGLGEAFLPPVPDLEGRLAADFGEGWSVTLAFEAGTLAGFLAVHPGDRVLGQIFLAAFLALPARANVPLAALVTFVTNPFTFPFWAVMANRTGAFVLNLDNAVGGDAAREIAHDGGALAGWFELAGVTAFGFVVLAIISAAVAS